MQRVQLLAVTQCPNASPALVVHPGMVLQVEDQHEGGLVAGLWMGVVLLLKALVEQAMEHMGKLWA